MPAYVIVDVTITDPQLYEEYKKLTPAAIAAATARNRRTGWGEGAADRVGLPGKPHTTH